MNIKQFTKFTAYGILIFSLLIIPGCSGNPMATSSPEEVEAGIKSGEYVKLSAASANQITRGREVFETVMKKYKPVIDFYGADSEVFRKMVNTNLMMNAERLTSPSEKMFNYDSMALWEDTEIVVEYDDGTSEALPAAELLAADGSKNPGWYRDGKKIVNYLVKQKKADEIVQKIADKTGTISKELKEFETMSDGFSDLSEKIQNREELSSLCNTPVKIGNWAGFTGTALSIIQMTGIIGSDMWPDSDEVINIKLDYVIDMIKGMYADLEYIETRLDEIQDVIENQFNKEIALNIKTIMAQIDGKIEEISNLQTLENKKTAAMNFIDVINGHIATYINYSETDYANYVEWQAGYDKTNPDYLPIPVKLNIPHLRHYPHTLPHDVKIECTLASFSMTNPNILMPFTYEGLEYFKNLVTTRMNINSFIEAEADLTAYNSMTSLTYLTSSDKYLVHLRNKINTAYIMLNQELKDTKNNINGPSTGVWTEAEHFTVKDNLDNMLGRINQGLLYISSYTYSDPENFTSQYKSYNRPTSGYYGKSDIWNYRVWYSSMPFSSDKSFGTMSEVGLNLNTRETLEIELVTHTFQYSPSIKFGTNTPIEFTKAVTDVTFLEDANATIDAYYKARTNKLLEFAASLAALEVQLALYLNDDDYAVYAQ